MTDVIRQRLTEENFLLKRRVAELEAIVYGAEHRAPRGVQVLCDPVDMEMRSGFPRATKIESAKILVNGRVIDRLAEVEPSEFPPPPGACL